MAKQVLKYGDFVGDTNPATTELARESFRKSKENFDELYARATGDMNKSVYDADNSGAVDQADKVTGIDAAGNITYYGKDSLGNIGFHVFSPDKVDAYANFASFPIAGFNDVIYIDKAVFVLYLWDDINEVYSAVAGGVSQGYVDDGLALKADDADLTALEGRVTVLEGAATPQEPISVVWNTGDPLTFSLPKAPSQVDINGSTLSKWQERVLETDPYVADEWSLSGTTVTVFQTDELYNGSNIQFHFGVSGVNPETSNQIKTISTGAEYTVSESALPDVSTYSVLFNNYAVGNQFRLSADKTFNTVILPITRASRSAIRNARLRIFEKPDNINTSASTFYDTDVNIIHSQSIDIDEIPFAPVTDKVEFFLNQGVTAQKDKLYIVVVDNLDPVNFKNSDNRLGFKYNADTITNNDTRVVQGITTTGRYQFSVWNAYPVELSFGTKDYSPLISNRNLFWFDLPEKIYATVGVEKSVYYSSITTRKDIKIKIFCYTTHGQFDNYRWHFTPTVTGQSDLFFRAYDLQNKLIEERVVTLVVGAKTLPATAKNILCIGDSITELQNTPQYIKAVFDSIPTGVKPVFVGTKGDVNAKHEGWSGQNSAFFIGASSPFKNPTSGLIDISYYRNNSGLSNTNVIDLVNIFLGFNDVGLTETDQQIKDKVLNYATLIDAFVLDNPSVKVAVNLPTFTSEIQGGWAYDITVKNRLIEVFRKELSRVFEKDKYSANVKLADAGLCIDRVNGYPLINKPLATVYTGTSVSTSDTVHPSALGCKEIAENNYPILSYFINL